MQTAKESLAKTNQVIQEIEEQMAELSGSLPKLKESRDKCQKVIKGLEGDSSESRDKCQKVTKGLEGDSSDEEDSSEEEEDANKND